uniref:Uncharacterized protein n=1 Tax=Branchiostoma floridae TaxID=7739 RepID=C3Z3L1_BRAFL|eukprot:XP_002596763.1 hypothetical protein BRAFLDRAFT_73743 [Branchiostoma floridae]
MAPALSGRMLHAPHQKKCPGVGGWVRLGSRGARRTYDALPALEGPHIIWTTTRIEALSQCQLVQVAMGETHGIALSSTGSVLCWGDRWEAQLGDNRACGTPSATPLTVHGLSNDIRQVAAGPRQSYCFTSQGQGFAWGSGASNMLCVGEEVHQEKAPVPMVGLPARPIHKIAGGGQHVLVLVDPLAPDC